VLNDGREIRALSASCTDLGCQLEYRPNWPDLRCPCHNASFNLRGWLANGPTKWQQGGPYRGDEEAYPIELPPLARPKVKVADGQILVWTARI
jgi:nitrite reductase/ring-hydroxylating ferredoxin subunit